MEGFYTQGTADTEAARTQMSDVLSVPKEFYKLRKPCLYMLILWRDSFIPTTQGTFQAVYAVVAKGV